MSSKKEIKIPFNAPPILRFDVAIMKPFTALSKFAWLNIDNKIVDATVDMIAGVIYGTGEKARKMQSGNLSSMLRWMVVGIVVLLALAIFYRPTV
jgi:NADH-quinone oxidoreductase subunit L